MKQEELEKVLRNAAAERGCELVQLLFNDDDNVFDATIDRKDGDVGLDDCEYVHRAVLGVFDRNVEDYALTVGSAGITAEEADELLKSINE